MREFIKEKNSYIQEIIRKTIISIKRNKIYEIFSNNDITLSLNILNDLLLEVSILENLAKSIGINLEYFFYSCDFDVALNGLSPYRKDKVLLREINSNHIMFGEHNSVHSYIKETHPEYFVSKMDIHFNNNGNRWYLRWLKERYDI